MSPLIAIVYRAYYTPSRCEQNRTMQLGDFTLTTISGGRFRLDGGAMFGVVPKPLWERCLPADEKNRVPMATNCLLIEAPDGTRTLIDTGYGTRFTDKQRAIYEMPNRSELVDGLNTLGLTPSDIDMVILSHLHFDHAGGGCQQNIDGQVRPLFTNAQYIVQRREWDVAMCGESEWSAIYDRSNFACLAESGQLELVDGDAEIAAGIQARLTGGHSPGHQAIVIQNGNEAAVYLGDICPTWDHLPMMWCMAYDANVVDVRREKTKLLGEIVDRQMWALSDHDSRHAAARLSRDKRRDFVADTLVESL
ncbi:MAG: MBL fold metallo-hydrolase [Pirellulaceae bacterium]|nr:MBL fold metallo-hydrolase [Planctomycetaceae bacterium]